MSSVESFGVKGVPFIVITNRNGYVVWQGRYCAYDYASFELFAVHTLSELSSTAGKCTLKNCDLCSTDITIDQEMKGMIAQVASTLCHLAQ